MLPGHSNVSIMPRLLLKFFGMDAGITQPFRENFALLLSTTCHRARARIAYRESLS